MIPALGLLVVGVALLFMPITRVWWLLGFLLAVVPETGPAIQVGASPISLKQGVLILAILATLVAVASGRLQLRLMQLGLWFPVVAATVLGSLQHGRLLAIIEFLLLFVVPFFVGVALRSNPPVARAFLKGLAVGAFLICLLAVAESVLDVNLLVQLDRVTHFVRSGRVRANAGWSFPTTLATFVVLAGFLPIRWASQRGFVLYVATCALVGGAVLATQGRTALLALAVGVVVYAVAQQRLSQLIRVAVGGAVVVGAALAIPGALPAGFRAYLSSSLTPGTEANANVAYRQGLYERAVAAMEHQPWFGYGAGSGHSVGANALSRYFGTFTDLASVPVSLVVQIGLIGAIPWVLIVLTGVFAVFRAKDLPDRAPILAGLVACLVAMAAIPLTLPVSLFLILLGYARAPAPADADPDDAATEPDGLDATRPVVGGRR